MRGFLEPFTDDIVLMYSEGKTLRHIAKLYGTDHHTVKRLLRNKNIPIRAKWTLGAHSTEHRLKISAGVRAQLDTMNTLKLDAIRDDSGTDSPSKGIRGEIIIDSFDSEYESIDAGHGIGRFKHCYQAALAFFETHVFEHNTTELRTRLAHLLATALTVDQKEKNEPLPKIEFTDLTTDDMLARGNMSINVLAHTRHGLLELTLTTKF